MLYEASEGAAGALRRLIEKADVFAQVAHSALAICHFDEAGSDLKPACHAVCHERLLSFENQGEALLPDRRFLAALAEGDHCLPDDAQRRITQPARVLPSASRAPEIVSCPLRLADGFYASPSILTGAQPEALPWEAAQVTRQRNRPDRRARLPNARHFPA